MTVRRYRDALSSTHVVRQLQPFHENLSKRQVKAPKVYVNDVGLLHALLDIETVHELESHPRAGFSWESACLRRSMSTRSSTVMAVRRSSCLVLHHGDEQRLLTLLADSAITGTPGR